MELNNGHKSNAEDTVNAEQPTHRTTEAPQFVESSGAFGSSILANFGANLATGQDVTAIYENFTTQLTPIVQVLAGQGLQVKTAMLLNSDKTDSVLAYDTILMAIKAGTTVIAYTYLVKEDIVHGTIEVAVPQYTADLSVSRYEDIVNIDRFASEAYDQTFKHIISTKCGTLWPDEGNLVVKVLPSKIWYPESTKLDDPEMMKNEINHGMENSLQALAPTFMSPSTCKRLTDLKRGGFNGLDVRVGGFLSEEAVSLTDEHGRATTPSISVSITALRNGQSDTSTLHRGVNARPIATLGIRTEVAWVGSPFTPPGAPKMFFTPGMENKNSFVPNIIVEDTKERSLSLEDLLLSLSTAYSVLSPEIVRSSFDPTSLGVLDMSCNILAKDVPEPMDSKAMNAEYETIYAQYMRTNVTCFSLVMRPGAHSVCTTRYLNNADPENESLVRTALDNMTGNAFSASYHGSIFATESEPEPYLVGTYSAPDGTLRPLSEIGTLQIMVMGHDNHEAIRYWIESQRADIDWNTSIGFKISALNKLRINYQLEEVYTLTSINTEVLNWMAKYINSKQLITSNNLNSYISSAGAGWGVNRLASAVGSYYGVSHGSDYNYNNIVDTPNGPMIRDEQGNLYPMPKQR